MMYLFKNYTLKKIFLFILILISIVGCNNKGDDPIVQPPGPQPWIPYVNTDVQFWLTTSDQTALFKRQNIALNFEAKTNTNSTIIVDDTQSFQTIDGFGYTLTGGSASLIYGLPSDKRQALLEELFKTDSTFIGTSYLRISIGASDMSAAPFTYDDIPNGQTDVNLLSFSLAKDKVALIPLLKEILTINPNIKILGSPWSPPVWMKSNGLFVGGSLRTEYYGVYANYFVKYIEAMEAEGITVDAITIQNEPKNAFNNPSLSMEAIEQANFIKNNLGPSFANAGLTTKIIIWDHNADETQYPIDVLNDGAAYPYIDGSAFHLYAGPINALSQVHEAFPDKNIYFTEQWTGGPGNFAGDLPWHLKNLIIGAPRNWSRNVLEWNLAANSSYGPHTSGGCPNCIGALTISGTAISRNVAYYSIAHAAKFVRPGSVRVTSNEPSSLANVAFKREDGKHVLIVLNEGDTSKTFNISYDSKIVTTTLAGKAIGTYYW